MPWVRKYQFWDFGGGEAESQSPGGAPNRGGTESQRWSGIGALVLEPWFGRYWPRGPGLGCCLATALAQHLISIRYKALAHQGGGATGTGEAAVVPVSVFKGHILAPAKS